MTTTRAIYVAGDGQTDFNVTFPYIDPAHVEAQVNSVPHSYTWLTSTQVRVANVQVGDVVRLVRKTPVDQALVTFQNGAVLTEEELNKAVRQTLYIQQELLDLYGETLDAAKVRLGANLGIVTDASAVMDELVQMVLADELVADLRARIADLDLLGEAVMGNSLNANNINVVLTQAVHDVKALIGPTGSVLSDLQAQVAAIIAESLPGLGTAITNEATARTDGDTALAQTLSLIGARTADGSAFDINLDTVKVGPTETFAQRLEALATESAGGADVLVATEATARIAGDTALGSLVDALDARTDATEAAIVNEATARAAADTAEATLRAALDARMGSAEAAISTEQSARIAADTAEATLRAALGATVGSLSAGLTAEQTARVAGDTAEANARTTLAARVTANEAAITNEATARTTADSAFAQQFSLLGAKNTAGTAWLLNQSTILVNPTTTLANRLIGIDTAIDNASASVVSEQTARIAADGVIASSVSAVSTTVAGHTASITALNSSTNGLLLKAGVALDSNGHVIGWSANNDGVSGHFDIVADKFSVVHPSVNGGLPVTVFEASGGVLRVPNLYVENLVVGSVQTPHLATGAVADFATYRDTGSVSASNDGDGTVTALTLAKTTLSGSSVKITVNISECLTQVGAGSGVTGAVTKIALHRNGVLVRNWNTPLTTVSTTATSLSTPLSLGALDTPPAGTNTYTLSLTAFARPGSGRSVTVTLQDREMILEEMKKST